ncbi:MAG: DUF4349 domain-containing protein [Acidimicrobiia bacterium]|nr:DUF4349 domain-containing protein [Acidimicrobiia bacterium]
MTADLLRQLDAYGDHIETLIDHVDVDEIMERSKASPRPKPKAEPARRPTKWLPRLATAGAVASLIAVFAVGINSGTTVDSNFDQIGIAEEYGDGIVGAQDRPSPKATAPPPTAAPTTVAATAPPTTAPSGGEPSGGEPSGGDALSGRDIVFVATMEVSVSDAVESADRAARAVEALGGFVSGEKTTGGVTATSVLTFKVPPVAFRTAVERIGDLGVVTDQEITADDVTEIVVDLQSQITSTELSVERLRTFLADATSVADVAKLERELTERERILEQLRGQLRTLEDRVALATISVTLTEAIQNPKFRVSTGAYPARDDEGAGCLGERPLQIPFGDDATVCIQIANTGKTELMDIALSGPGLAVLTGNLIEVEGQLGGVLEPDGVVVLAADLTVERRIREDLTVTATPINEAGDPVSERTLQVTKRIAIDIATPEEPGGLPGFADSWNSGVGALAAVGSVLLVVLGAVLPWLWLPAIALGIVWWRRR